MYKDCLQLHEPLIWFNIWQQNHMFLLKHKRFSPRLISTLWMKVCQELSKKTKQNWFSLGSAFMKNERLQYHLLHRFEQGLSVVLEWHDELQLSAAWLHSCERNIIIVTPADQLSKNKTIWTHTHTLTQPSLPAFMLNSFRSNSHNHVLAVMFWESVL